ncbi:WAS/WASL-interacting protein family member 1-like isoform X2 [Dromiciops gliroides]|uniref:WAS/WASL-interacting protein family member 1-like isoform X2 n=1 Tax=Dromiciops gliroides TaxID=33562 RepID=UPI001CC49651|nr:WAS/WASL-interacting protein family member 1-like isoform X2 [Dromiciops gliroides]
MTGGSLRLGGTVQSGVQPPGSRRLRPGANVGPWSREAQVRDPQSPPSPSGREVSAGNRTARGSWHRHPSRPQAGRSKVTTTASLVTNPRGLSRSQLGAAWPGAHPELPSSEPGHPRSPGFGPGRARKLSSPGGAGAGTPPLPSGLIVPFPTLRRPGEARAVLGLSPSSSSPSSSPATPSASVPLPTFLCSLGAAPFPRRQAWSFPERTQRTHLPPPLHFINRFSIQGAQGASGKQISLLFN